MSAIYRRPHLRRHVSRINNIFDADRYAMKRAALRPRIERPRFTQDQVRIQERPRLQGRFAGFNAREAIAGNILATNLSIRDTSNNLGGRKTVQWFHCRMDPNLCVQTIFGEDFLKPHCSSLETIKR